MDEPAFGKQFVKGSRYNIQRRGLLLFSSSVGSKGLGMYGARRDVLSLPLFVSLNVCGFWEILWLCVLLLFRLLWGRGFCYCKCGLVEGKHRVVYFRTRSCLCKYVCFNYCNTSILLLIIVSLIQGVILSLRTVCSGYYYFFYTKTHCFVSTLTITSSINTTIPVSATWYYAFKPATTTTISHVKSLSCATIRK